MLNYIVYIGITYSIQQLFVQGMDPYDHEESSDARKTEPQFLSQNNYQTEWEMSLRAGPAFPNIAEV